MSVRSVAAAPAAGIRSAAAVLIAVAALTGCGQSSRVLDARVEADRMLVRERTGTQPGTVLLRNGESMRASEVDLLPERTRWTAAGEDGDSVRVDVPTVSIRSILLTQPRRPLWKHMIAGAALGLLVGGVLADDFGDGSADATLFLWGGLGAAGGGLGGLAGGREEVFPVTGGVEIAPPPP